jgi:hypothetical protein
VHIPIVSATQEAKAGMDCLSPVVQSQPEQPDQKKEGREESLTLCEIC